MLVNIPNMEHMGLATKGMELGKSVESLGNGIGIYKGWNMV